MRPLLLFANPAARSGQAAPGIEAALRALRGRGIEVELVRTERGGRTPGLVEREVRLRRPERVAYLGGDGTFREVASGLLRSGVEASLGLLPMGTANNNGKSLGLRSGPGAIEENVELLLRGHERPMDAGELTLFDEHGEALERTHFFDTVGWGLQAEVIAARDRDRHRVERVPILRSLYRDQAVYAGAMVRTLLASLAEPTRFDAELLVDGAPLCLEGLTDLVLLNSPIYGGEWAPSRAARLDDGRFDLVTTARRRDLPFALVRDLAALPASLAASLASTLAERLGADPRAVIQGARFELRMRRPRRPSLGCQVDGDVWRSGSRFRIRVLPGALTVIGREGFVPGWR